MKKQVISFIMGVCMCLTLLPTATFAASPYRDVDQNAVYAEAVEYLRKTGIMVGDSGYFNPDTSVTRAEMATIVCRVVGATKNLSTTTRFSDVPISHWANGYIAKAAELGIVNGTGDGKFSPSANVTYEQVLTMIVRAKGLVNRATPAGGYPYGSIQGAMVSGYTKGLSNKTGDYLQRSQIAMLLYNVMNGSSSNNAKNTIIDALTGCAWSLYGDEGYYVFKADGTVLSLDTDPRDFDNMIYSYTYSINGSTVTIKIKGDVPYEFEIPLVYNNSSHLFEVTYYEGGTQVTTSAQKIELNQSIKYLRKAADHLLTSDDPNKFQACQDLLDLVLYFFEEDYSTSDYITLLKEQDAWEKRINGQLDSMGFDTAISAERYVRRTYYRNYTRDRIDELIGRM